MILSFDSCTFSACTWEKKGAEKNTNETLCSVWMCDHCIRSLSENSQIIRHLCIELLTIGQRREDEKKTSFTFLYFDFVVWEMWTTLERDLLNRNRSWRNSLNTSEQREFSNDLIKSCQRFSMWSLVFFGCSESIKHDHETLAGKSHEFFFFACNGSFDEIQQFLHIFHPPPLFGPTKNNKSFVSYIHHGI